MVDFFAKTTKPIVIALGFFDGAHLGHREIFSVAKKLCKKEKSDFAVFTFNGKMFKNSNGNIYTLQEKLNIFKKLGAKEVIVANWEQKLYSLSPQDFLDELISLHNVKGIVCGEDFTFGNKALGNAKFLKEYCLKKDIKLEVVSLKKYNGVQISSSIIKEKLICGDIKTANLLLGENYFINGVVVHGRGEGSKKTFPTANVKITEDKLKIKSGVYACIATVDGKSYNAITNVGVAPTFNFEEYLIETHLLDFSYYIYNKEIRIEFLEYLREIKKFNSVEELKMQIKKDMEYFK